MENKYLLDSSVLIGSFRNNPRAKDLINNIEGEFCISVIVLAEIYEGLERSKNHIEVKAWLQKIVSKMIVFDITKNEAKIFGKIRTYLKEKGQIIPDMDLLIAATCLANNLILVTLDADHFKRIPGLIIKST